jgi:hypothetical protein
METTSPTLIEEQVTSLTAILARLEKAIAKNEAKESSLPDSKESIPIKKGLRLTIDNDKAFIDRLKTDIADLKQKLNS